MSRISVWNGATLSGVFYITVSITAFVLCSPWHGETMLETTLSGHYFKFCQFSIQIGAIIMLVELVLFHSSNSGSFSFADVYCKEDWRVDHHYGRIPVSTLLNQAQNTKKSTDLVFRTAIAPMINLHQTSE